ncbi:MAG: ABC transporter substrate-binding protein [candidate division WOR-3 bacterium]
MKSFKKILFVLLALLIFMSLVNAQAPLRLPREETLYYAGFQWGPPASFNPFSSNPAWPVAPGNNYELVYETLFAYNLLTGRMDPILGESYKWVSLFSLEVKLRKGTKWQDGTPLTSKDVVYTFQLGKKYSLYFSPLWNFITDVKAKDDSTIIITLNKERPHKKRVETFLGQILIVPQHIWSKIDTDEKNLKAYFNEKPVGSGPYKLLYYSPEQIVIERDDNYWGIPYFGKPAPKYIVHPIFKSNDAGNLALEKGEVDLSQQFCPEIWKMWEVKKLPISTWYRKPPYHIPASMPSLWINVNKYPLSLPQVRRALAFAINYPKIAEIAMSRYSDVVKSSLILPVGPESKYFVAEDVEQYGWKYDPKKAVEILEKELKAKKGPDGIYVLPDGTRLGPFIAECPYGWTDWMTSLEIVAESARAVGIDIRTQFPDAPVAYDHRMTGNFDLVMWTPAGGQSPSHPYLRFYEVMEIRGVPPIGQTAYWNFGRYSNKLVSALLDSAAKAENEEKLKDIYRRLNQIFMKDIPIIPLEYRPWYFYQYNETYWTGFPNEDNPIAPPTHGFAGRQVLFVIKPKK